MRKAMANLLKRIKNVLSLHQRKEYEEPVARVVAALESGKLKSDDKATLAIPVINRGQPGWLSPLDGIDWAELQLLAKECELPFEMVNDLLVLLRTAIGKM
jgi:hypothetical protein